VIKFIYHIIISKRYVKLILCHFSKNILF